MEQLTTNQAVATSQEAVQNQKEPQLRDENAHNYKSVHGVLNPTYQAGLRRDAVQPFSFFKQKTAYEILAGLEFRRVLFRSGGCEAHGRAPCCFSVIRSSLKPCLARRLLPAKRRRKASNNPDCGRFGYWPKNRPGRS